MKKLSDQKTILVAPLDWGLDHATRCIPIIQSLLDQQHKVIIASSGKQEALLKEEFPDLPFIKLEGYSIDYPNDGSMVIKMLWQLPKIKKAIEEEHSWLDKVIDKHKIDEVVSDNRYGLWNKKVKSIIVTHQLFIKAPTGEWLIERVLKRYLDNFDEVQIPDIEGADNLSGDLSHKKPLPSNYKFIGLLSRFSNQKVSSNTPIKSCHPESNRRTDNFEYDFIAIVSGPEPQRTIFEKLILEQVEDTDLKGVLVRGLPENSCHSELIEEDKKTLRQAQYDKKRLKIFNHLSKVEFLNYLEKSKVVISRSGYSTIMDLSVLDKKAILVPTPGQTEQEYLAEYHQLKKSHSYQKQIVELKNLFLCS